MKSRSLILKYLLLITVIVLPVIALEYGNNSGIVSSTDTYSTVTNNQEVSESTDSRYAKVLPDSYTKNYLELPKMVPGFRSKIKRIDFKSGKIDFFIYDSRGDLLPYELSYINKYLKENIALSLEQKKKISTKVKSLYTDILLDQDGMLVEDVDESLIGNLKESNELANAIRSAEQKYFGKKSLSIEGTYTLTTSEYCLAVITLDGSIINLPDSMLYNRIILNQGFSLKGEKNNGEPAIAEVLGNTVLLFAFNVATKLNEINLDLKLYVLGIFMPLTIGYTAFSKSTKFIQKIQDHDNLIEQGVMGLLVLGLFYFTSIVHKSDNMQYNQTVFQTNITGILKKGVKYADQASNMVTSSYVNFQRNNIGVKSAEEFRNLYRRKVINSNVLSYSKSFDSVCNKTFSSEKLEQYKGVYTKDGLLYPRTEDLFQKYQKKIVIGSEEMFYIPGTNKSISLTACNENSKQWNYLKTDQNNIDNYIQEIIESNKSEKNQKEINILTSLYEDSFKYSYEHGFIHAPFIMLIDSAIKGIHRDSEFNKNEKKFQETNYGNSFEGQKSLQVELLNNKVELSGEQLNYLFSNLPYMLIPPATSIKEIITDILPTSTLSQIPFIGGMAEAFTKMASMPITVYIMQEFINFSPFVGISIAGVAVITYLFGTIFIYTYLSPYLVVYIFSTQQTEKVKKFLVKGILLAMKPLLIVLSVVVTIVVIRFIDILSVTIIQNEFTLLMKIARNGMDFTSNPNINLVDIILLIIKGTVALSAKIISIFMSVYMILKGPDIILSVLGIDDGGTGVDIKEHVGQDIDNKNRLNNPGV